jgi:hypothetical protein
MRTNKQVSRLSCFAFYNWKTFFIMSSKKHQVLLERIKFFLFVFFELCHYTLCSTDTQKGIFILLSELVR